MGKKITLIRVSTPTFIAVIFLHVNFSIYRINRIYSCGHQTVSYVYIVPKQIAYNTSLIEVNKYSVCN